MPGEFEYLLLRAAARLTENAYDAAIRAETAKATGTPHLYTTLARCRCTALIFRSPDLISSPASLAVGEIELSRNAVVWQPILAAGKLSARPAALAFCAAGNLACRRPFRPPFSMCGEFVGLLHLHTAIDEAEEIRPEALRRLKSWPTKWPKPRDERSSPGQAQAWQSRHRLLSPTAVGGTSAL